MTKQNVVLDRVFHALSDSTRRAVLRRLSLGSASVSELAAPFDMALPSFMQHLRVLQDSGLVLTRKSGRVRTCEIRQKELVRAEKWISLQRDLWKTRSGRLGAYLDQLQANENDIDDIDAAG